MKSMGACNPANCTGCCSSACDSRVGFGLYVAPTGSASAIGSLAKTALSFVPGGSLIGSLISGIGKLFGAAPRGELQKFQRTAYPYMRTLAAQSGIPVLIGWFGEAVAVNPDGSYGVILPDMTNYETRLLQQGYHPFYSATCSRSDGDCVNHPADLGFVLNDPYDVAPKLEEVVVSVSPTKTTETAIPQTGTGTLMNISPKPGSGGFMTSGMDISSLLLYGGIAAAAYLLLAGKGKK